jgi:hypothetical protein
MSQAQPYNRTKNFLDNSGDRTDHAALNTELDNASVSINELRANQALIQADDGSLKPETVDFDQLTAAAKAGLATPGPQGATGPAGPAGSAGPTGPQGPKGETGASFDADASGVFSERAGHDDEPKGYSFLAMDTGLLYWKLTGGNADWSDGVPFGKGQKGDTGAQGPQGPQGIQGFRGANGLQGAQGPQGPAGPAGTVDYSRTVQKDTTTQQTMQAILNAAGFTTAQSSIAKVFAFYQANVKAEVIGGRVSFTQDQTSNPDAVGLKVADVISNGTGALATGYKLANGDDIGTLFDPSGAADSKLATVDVNPVVVDITGKTSITLALQVVGSEIKLVASAS